LRLELISVGYVYVETNDFVLDFFRDFDRAISVINRFGLEYLGGLNKILYNRALQERVLPALRDTVDKLRMEEKSVEEEILARQEFARKHSWIPGLVIEKKTREEISEERSQVSEPIPVSTLTCSIKSKSSYSRKVSINDITADIIPHIFPLDIFKILRELNENLVMIPEELAAFCETGWFTREDIDFARKFLQENVDSLKAKVMSARQ
jgi:hypothetical protein